MSIRDSAYQLCKSFRQSASADELANVIMGIQTFKPAISDSDRTILGFYARKKYIQVLGYLFIDQYREQIKSAENPLTLIPPLKDSERNLLAWAHCKIVELNHRCIEPLLNAIPQCASAVSPYSRFIYKEPESSEDAELFDTNIASSVIAAFHSHPGINIALSTLEPYKGKIDENHYRNHILKLEDFIAQDGAFTSSDEVRSLKKADPQNPYNRHMLAIMCVRDSLYNLNQLIYQAIFTGKLFVLGEENIIDVAVETVHSTGLGVGLLFQPSRFSMLDSLMVDEKLIVLLKANILRREENLLMRIESLREESSRAFGRLYLADLRQLDEQLNSFPGLLG